MLSVTTPAQIKNNPSNNSTAKHHWSFSKSPRFQVPRAKYFYCYSAAPTQPTIASPAYPIGEPPLAMGRVQNILTAVGKSPSQAHTSYQVTSNKRRSNLVLASPLTGKISCSGTTPKRFK